MNLIQIQDQLKSLPSDPRTMQALTAYANGANPAVPPYLALGELNRRKQLAERAQMEQAGQPPQGTVKDQVEQQAGIMALQQGQQQQAMQNAMRMGASAPQGIPANIPQPAAQSEVQAARGGLMSLLADRARARRMNSGGIVALAPAGSVAEAQDSTNDQDPDSVADVDSGGATAADVMKELARQRMMAERLIKGMKAPNVESPIAARKRMIAENPEYAYLAEDPEKDVVARLDELQAAKRAELDKQREEAAATKPGILQLLGRAAMDTRGQYGKSALASILGGYERISSGEEQKAVEREQALRAKDLEMQQAKMETITKLRDLKRARDEGDIDGEQKAKVELAKLAQQQGTTVANLIGRMMTSTGGLAGSLRRAEATETSAREATNRAQIVKPGEKERIMARVAQLRAEGKDDEADQMIKNYNALSGSTAAVGGINAQRAILNTQLREANNVLKSLDATDEEKAQAKSDRARILEDLAALQAPGTQKSEPKPIPVPQSLPDGLTPQNASKLLKVGSIYDTAKGPGKWNGKSFDPVK